MYISAVERHVTVFLLGLKVEGDFRLLSSQVNRSDTIIISLRSISTSRVEQHYHFEVLGKHSEMHSSVANAISLHNVGFVVKKGLSVLDTILDHCKMQRCRLVNFVGWFIGIYA